MLKGQVKIVNRLGVHARAAAKLVNVASAYESDIQIGDGARMVSAKSIMSVMMLAASYGTTLELEVDGSDEASAYAAIQELVENRFDEAE